MDKGLAGGEIALVEFKPGMAEQMRNSVAGKIDSAESPWRVGKNMLGDLGADESVQSRDE